LAVDEHTGSGVLNDVFHLGRLVDSFGQIDTDVHATSYFSISSAHAFEMELYLNVPTYAALTAGFVQPVRNLKPRNTNTSAVFLSGLIMLVTVRVSILQRHCLANACTAASLRSRMRFCLRSFQAFFFSGLAFANQALSFTPGCPIVARHCCAD